MGLASIITVCIIGLVLKDVIALPCLSVESKTKFQATRKALANLQTSIESRIANLQNDIKNKIKKLDDDMGSLVSDFETTLQADWRTFSKIDDAAENKWLFNNRTKKDDYWMGLTDLKEGEFRWSYDQTKASFKTWYSGYGSKGTSYNCGLMYGNTYAWLDYPCERKFLYVTEVSKMKTLASNKNENNVFEISYLLA
ncbi:unnamed protein product [Mytilus edulis]|uniref:C-type lectin domain-containing protein n=1 Tax=Mytilus edulis TaxID=6550 RepID=A0A8S3Q8Y5_MYTED|nr:unnamed protein product [Mytilus edulis]